MLRGTPFLFVISQHLHVQLSEVPAAQNSDFSDPKNEGAQAKLGPRVGRTIRVGAVVIAAVLIFVCG